MLRRQLWAFLSHANEAGLRVVAFRPREARKWVVMEREQSVLTRPLYMSTLTEGG
jgi:hypothetical protein